MQIPNMRSHKAAFGEACGHSQWSRGEGLRPVLIRVGGVL
jgi:hypothetical protein